MSMPGRKYEAQGGYRYGFNGKELEISTISKNYDFGARMYDSRIGKFLSSDKLSQDFETSFSFAGNNPINYLDLNGYFKISPFFAKRYPTLAKVLELVLPGLKSNVEIRNRWISAIGFEKFEYGVSAWEDMLTFGSGPWVTPSRSLTELKNGLDQQLAKFFGASEGGQYVPAYPDNITIGWSIFDNLETALKSGNGTETSYAAFVVMMQVMHEGGHWARNLCAGKAPRGDFSKEDGALVEEAITNGIRFSYRNHRYADLKGQGYNDEESRKYFNKKVVETFGTNRPSGSGMWIPHINICLDVKYFGKNIPSGTKGDKTVTDNNDKEPDSTQTKKNSDRQFSYMYN